MVGGKTDLWWYNKLILKVISQSVMVKRSILVVNYPFFEKFGKIQLFQYWLLAAGFPVSAIQTNYGTSQVVCNTTL